jgi:hypothetical protein
LAWREIGWPYVAGFFDAEGSVTPHGNHFRVSLYQSGEARVVLEVIEKFLKGQGISCGITQAPWRKRQTESSLYITNFSGAMKFIRKVEPFVIEKIQTVGAVYENYNYVLSYQRDIRWQYVAGFFDGEGTITHDYRRFPSVKVYQNGDALVLHEISEFMQDKGIANRVRSYKRIMEDKEVATNFIEVGRQKAIKRLLERLMPHLIVKQAKAESTLGEIYAMTQRAKNGELHFNSARAYI